MKKITEVSDSTSFGNPKEVRLTEKLKDELLNPDDIILDKIKEVSERNKFEEIKSNW